MLSLSYTLNPHIDEGLAIHHGPAYANDLEAYSVLKLTWGFSDETMNVILAPSLKAGYTISQVADVTFGNMADKLINNRIAWNLYAGVKESTRATTMEQVLTVLYAMDQTDSKYKAARKIGLN